MLLNSTLHRFIASDLLIEYVTTVFLNIIQVTEHYKVLVSKQIRFPL